MVKKEGVSNGVKLEQKDKQIADLIEKETERQETSLEMIPSENHTSSAVREALGSLLTDKYAEGYPGKRYYAGLEYYDQIEDIRSRTGLIEETATRSLERSQDFGNRYIEEINSVDAELIP